MKKTRFDDGRNVIGYRDRFESNTTPRFRADETGDMVTVGAMERELRVLNFGKLFGKTYK
jgi:hypothetical protein